MLVLGNMKEEVVQPCAEKSGLGLDLGLVQD